MHAARLPRPIGTLTIGADGLARLLLALAVLLIFAHGAGYAFARLHQPRVVGEIAGGLLLGPTVFGAAFPDMQHAVFPAEGPVTIVLDGIYQLGLLLLMFASGAEMRTLFARREAIIVATISLVGLALPFAAGVLFVGFLDPRDHLGPAGSTTSFALVLAIAVAVTSIPVIARIMRDLGILETPFARVILAVGVIEDVVLYVVLAIALGLATSVRDGAGGLPQLLGIDSASAVGVIYYLLATTGLLALGSSWGAQIYRRFAHARFNLAARGSPIGSQLIAMLAVSLLAVALGVVPLFGAFIAGMATSRGSAEEAGEHRRIISEFGAAFFIPIYFALVGLRLDLGRGFDVAFFAAFLAYACVAKAGSVYVAARLLRLSRETAANLAVALNARGGPGIVLASVAFDAGIINGGAFSVLVLLALTTSLVAGSWLERAVRRSPARGDWLRLSGWGTGGLDNRR